MQEQELRVVPGGQTASTSVSSELAAPVHGNEGASAPSVLIQRADNLHLRAREDGSKIAGPTPSGHPGCPECVHVHWRWSQLLNRNDPAGALVVSPRFDNNGGDPIIPAGSNQDADIAVVADKPNELGPDPNNQLYANGEAIGSATSLAFWYSATGHQNSDSFFTHGGFFSSLRAEIGNPGIVTNNALLPSALQQAFVCPGVVQFLGGCPIVTAIKNRTGHSVTWKATLTNQSGAVVGQGSGDISGSQGQEVSGQATVLLPGGFTLLPTYILRVRVTDDNTGWSTERAAYVTQLGFLLSPL